MEKIKEKRTTLLIVAVSVLICFIAGVLIVRQRSLNASQPEIVPLSSIVLQPTDMPQSFLWTGRSSNCSQYLVLITENDEAAGVPSECYQVKYSLADNSVIVLNAIWKFNDPTFVQAEFRRAVEFMPPSGNMELRVLDIPSLGEGSSGLLATMKGGLSVIATYNLYWKYGNAIARITIIGDQNTISQNDLMILAGPVQARLEEK